MSSHKNNLKFINRYFLTNNSFKINKFSNGFFENDFSPTFHYFKVQKPGLHN